MLPKATTFIFQLKDAGPVADMAVSPDWLIKMKKRVLCGTVTITVIVVLISGQDS